MTCSMLFSSSWMMSCSGNCPSWPIMRKCQLQHSQRFFRKLFQPRASAYGQWQNQKVALHPSLVYSFQLPLLMPPTALLRRGCASFSSNPTMGIEVPSQGTLTAVLFDVDGTLCDSDVLHFKAFHDMLLEVGFQDGVPIDEDFFKKYVSGKHNSEIGLSLFPDWEQSRRDKFLDDKEAYFRSLVGTQLHPIEGLSEVCKWIKDKGLKRAAVTNAPRENAELMMSSLGLSDFFEAIVIGSECERPKPFPDPYLKALKELNVPADRAFVFEDSITGVKAAVAAELATIGMAFRNPADSLLQAGASLTIKSYADKALWSVLEKPL